MLAFATDDVWRSRMTTGEKNGTALVNGDVSNRGVKQMETWLKILVDMVKLHPELLQRGQGLPFGPGGCF